MKPTLFRLQLVGLGVCVLPITARQLFSTSGSFRMIAAIQFSWSD